MGKLLSSEDALARRVTHERERRGWSPAQLAKAMTDAGQPMNQSSIWKIENARPRRKITVDEAVTFAQVFDMTLDELMVPPEMAADDLAFDLIGKYLEQQLAVHQAQAESAETVRRLDKLLRQQPGLKDRVVEYLTRNYPDRAGEEARQLLERDDLAAADRWQAMFEMLSVWSDRTAAAAEADQHAHGAAKRRAKRGEYQEAT
jgi:transcriptional regulator with XRE-family HTH domain